MHFKLDLLLSILVEQLRLYYERLLKCQAKLMITLEVQTSFTIIIKSMLGKTVARHVALIEKIL